METASQRKTADLESASSIPLEWMCDFVFKNWSRISFLTPGVVFIRVSRAWAAGSIIALIWSKKAKSSIGSYTHAILCSNFMVMNQLGPYSEVS